jgi:hypothetical protein
MAVSGLQFAKSRQQLPLASQQSSPIDQQSANNERQFTDFWHPTRSARAKKTGKPLQRTAKSRRFVEVGNVSVVRLRSELRLKSHVGGVSDADYALPATTCCGSHR